MTAATLFDLFEELAVLRFDSTVSIPHREQVVPDEKRLVSGIRVGDWWLANASCDKFWGETMGAVAEADMYIYICTHSHVPRCCLCRARSNGHVDAPWFRRKS